MVNYNPGLLMGIVTDNQDPDELGRIKVSIDLLGETITTDWIPILNFYSSPEAGSYFLPDIDTKVIVSFIGKGVYNPIVLGGIWGSFQPPPVSEENSGADLNGDGENTLKFIRSRSGQRIIFDDTDGEEKIQIISKDAATRFEFLVADEMVNIESDKDITIKAGGKLSIEAEETTMTFEGGMSLEAAGLAVDASDALELKSGSGITVEGSAVKLN